MSRNIALASDHAGFELKNSIKEYLEEQGITCLDCGVYSADRADYPDYAQAGCQAVLDGKSELAILVCGTGVGISVAANKIDGIRACCCSDTFSAEFSRKHNDANVLCFGARVVGEGLAQKLVDAFLGASFEGGRHADRVKKIMALEKNN